MSVEAQALGKLLSVIEEQSKNPTFNKELLHRKIRQIEWSAGEAKYWISPVQHFRDKLYNIWECNKAWTRPQFLDWIKADDMTLGGWSIRCICLGDMNYRVENDGFEGWLKAEGHGTDVDFEVLVNLCRSLKTPVGYKVASLISTVQIFLMGIRRGDEDEDYNHFAEDLKVLTEDYLAIRYDFLVEVERKLRVDVPMFQPRPPL
jgi:hypothetical protein